MSATGNQFGLTEPFLDIPSRSDRMTDQSYGRSGPPFPSWVLIQE